VTNVETERAGRKREDGGVGGRQGELRDTLNAIQTVVSISLECVCVDD